MKGVRLRNVLFIAVTVLSFKGAFVVAQNGDCEIDGIVETDWITEYAIEIKDVDRGETFRKKTGNITGIRTISFPANELNVPNSYVSAKLENGELVITLSEAFDSYEQSETSLKFTMNIDFTCQRQTRQLNVVHKITDTNNNKPEFKPTDTFDYTIYTPTGAGIPITYLYGDLIVRDIDLTTKSILFGIEENSFLDIEYDRVDSTKKNHYARLVTKKVIMGIDEPIVLTITAEDVDDTGDPSNKITTTVTLKSDPATQLPVAPVFNNAFYTAVYDKNNITFNTEIKVAQGYDNTVNFALDGTGSEYFEVSNKESIVTVSLKMPLPENLIQENEFLLFSLEAKKEDTSGANAAIHIYFLKVSTALLFDSSTYKGFYEPGNFTLEKIELSGLTDDTKLTLTGESSEYFKPEISSDNTISIELVDPLPENVLNEFNYISFELKAVVNNSSAVATILIDFPSKELPRLLIFSETVYKGTYFHGNLSLQMESIILEFGYEEDVKFSLSGDFSEQFSLENSDNVIQINIANGSLPEVGNYITLTITAQGKNALEASAAIVIEVEKEPEYLIYFEEPYYEGVYYYENNTLIAPEIILEEGYTEDIIFSIDGEYKDYFSLSNDNNIVTIKAIDDFPESVGENNLYVALTIIARNSGSLSTSTIITIGIIKETAPENNNLEFQKLLYEGSYEKNETLTLETIILEKGYNDNTTFEIVGEYSEYFTVENNKNQVKINLKEPLPTNVVNTNSYLVLSLEAKTPDFDKALTSIIISLPTTDQELEVLRFEYPLYEGIYNDDNILNIDKIMLKEGYSETTIFTLSGQHNNYFTVTNEENIVEIGLNSSLPIEIISSNLYLTFTLEANSPNAIGAITVININLPSIDITDVLLFESNVYSGFYNYESTSLVVPQIKLNQGYDNNTQFKINGDWKDYFDFNNTENILNIILTENLPDDLLDEVFIFLEIFAEKPNALTATTVLTITLIGKSEDLLNFEQPYYEGVYNNSGLEIEPIHLLGNTENVSFNFVGEYDQYFNAELRDNDVYITVNITEDIVNKEDYILLILEAKTSLSSDYTTIFIKLLKDQNIEIKFESSEYNADITTSTLGEILTVKASSNPPVTINYRLDIDNEYLKSRIQISSSTGIITVSSFLNIDTYNFIVIAENLNVFDNAKVTLKVRDANSNDINLDPLIITSVIEHGKYDEIFNLGDSITKQNCSYEISNSWPSVENWFYINNQTGYLASYKEIDREDPLISELSQLQLEFTLSCDKETNHLKNIKKQQVQDRTSNFADESERYLISASSIKYAADKRYLTILVEDINDHQPEFLVDNPLIIGYPSSDIVFTIRPPFLTSVQAIDEDVGENGNIKYITFDRYFTIHPESGVVYPKDNALLSLNTDYDLVVFAVDQNGNGLNSSLSIKVKPLSMEHLSVMKLKNVLIEDVSDILTAVSNELQISIKALHSVVIPEEKFESKNEVRSFMKILKTSFLPKEDINSYLSIFIYGVDKNLELLDSSMVVDKIENTQLNGTWNVEATKLEDSVFLKSQDKDENKTGLIIAVSILGSLLFLAITGFCIWFFLILPKSYRRMTNSSMTSSSASSSSSSSDDSEDSKSGSVDFENSTKPVQSNGIINNQDLSTTLEGIITPSDKFTKEVRMSPPPQNKMQSRNYMDMPLSDVNYSTEKQKPVVTFNETVQQIEVDEYEVERL